MTPDFLTAAGAAGSCVALAIFSFGLQTISNHLKNISETLERIAEKQQQQGA